MKRVFLSLTLLCAPVCASAYDLSENIAVVSARASAELPLVEAPGASVAGFISLWTQDCSTTPCALPQGVMPARKAVFDMALPSGPGQAQVKVVRESFTVEGLGELNVRLSFYAICPFGASEGCPSRYFQVQAELSGAVLALCAASLNAGDFLPFPVFMCAGVPAPGRRVGITLSRREL